MEKPSAHELSYAPASQEQRDRYRIARFIALASAAVLPCFAVGPFVWWVWPVLTGEASFAEGWSDTYRGYPAWARVLDYLHLLVLPASLMVLIGWLFWRRILIVPLVVAAVATTVMDVGMFITRALDGEFFFLDSYEWNRLGVLLLGACLSALFVSRSFRRAANAPLTAASTSA